MLDFFMISNNSVKKDTTEVFPRFIIKKSKDLMIRGGDFYAVWDEKKGCWSTDEQDAIDMIDAALDEYLKTHTIEGSVIPKRMWDSKSGMIDAWHKYCQKQMRDNYHPLDEELIFSNTKTSKENYSSRHLDYALEKGDISAYDQLMSTLYSEEERRKLEWAIGSVVNGDSKKIQKFIVMHGEAGTGKSTVLEIIQKLFYGYYATFESKALGNPNSTFALEAFKTNPLVAIEHDGDLSHIEDNTRLNSLVSHEIMTVNEKHKSLYSMRFNSFLFIGSNKHVKITDAKSGLIRRLIDVRPTGNKLPRSQYNKLMKQIDFELGAIAYHCKEVYESDPGYYDSYVPTQMLSATNDFYNFVLDSYLTFSREDCVSMKSAWEMYKAYCEEASVMYPLSQRVFKEELKNYFNEVVERYTAPDGSRVRNVYLGFRTDKFNPVTEEPKEPEEELMVLDQTVSIFDKECKDYPAQYARDGDVPCFKWKNVTTKLADIDTSKIHFVQVPQNHIVIDFDLKDENGDKSLLLNLKAASRWPKTYAEISKGGNGIHLHYIYEGDVSELEPIYSENIEVKVYAGNSSLRRKLTKCNSYPIAKLNSGLPLKTKEKKMLNEVTLKSEKSLRDLIIRNLKKEIHPYTAPSMSFIKKILDDAYSSGLKYDVSDLYNDVLIFAVNSSHQKDACIKMIKDMKFKSEEPSANKDSRELPLAFFDIEIVPNLFLVCWKLEGKDKPVISMFNPSSTQIEELITNYRLVGFNNRSYDNHMLYAALLGYSVDQLYNLSQHIINDKTRKWTFGEAYNISYTDIYDFSVQKQSLKKWEIEMKIHHQELGFPWDQPIPEEKWDEVASYCANDVTATEALFNYLSGPWESRQILAKLAQRTVNDTTNSLTAKIVFGDEKHPQRYFNYPDLKQEFPDYRFEMGKSYYKDEEIGEGGYVYSEPGIYYDVVTYDIAGMHPATMRELRLFGKFTDNFGELVDTRLAAKHKDRPAMMKAFNGKLAEYANSSDEELKRLADALKIAINSVYGQTAAKYDNPFRDKRNVDNVVAKRGALFMATLKERVQEMGYTVAHIKTDSIKVPNTDEKVGKFITEFGKQYGYTFEIEDEYRKICLVNKAVYIAQHKDGSWTATGAQFAVPYVFKTLFSKEPLEFDDYCETKSSQTALYLDMNEGLPDVTDFEKELKKITASKYIEKNGKDEDRIAYLESEIAKGHNYKFVGKVGQFCPVKEGKGGGNLVAISKDGTKYNSVSGSKGFKWMESETLRELKDPDLIDYSYFEKLCNEAIETISEYGDFEKFVND